MRRRELIAFLAAVLGDAAMRPGKARAQGQAKPAPAADHQVGEVATLQGSATVTRGAAAPTALKVSEAIFKNDALETGDNSSLGITFDDETTFSLSANAHIAVDEFVYQEGGKGNSAVFNIARGTVAFVASKVAKTGKMTIATPTANLGIRGTIGVVDVPADPAAGEATIKLYPDADGHVGRIQVFNRQGELLGALTRGASAFALRPGLGGRLIAAPFRILPQIAARDRGMVRQLLTVHNIGRRLLIQRRQLRIPNLRLPNLLQQPKSGRGRQQRGGLREKLQKLNPFR